MEDIKIIETPTDKHKIEIKTWLSARDYRALDESMMPPEMEVKLSPEDVEKIRKDPSMRGQIIPKEFIIKGKDAMDTTKREQDTKITVAIISIDDNKEKMLERVLGFKKDDFEFILTEIDKVIEGEKKN